MKSVLLVLVLISQFTVGQRLNKADKTVIENIKTEISYLASDELQGRRTGTPGEKMAYEYLSTRFEKAGLIPKGDGNSFIQAFEINEGKQISSSSHLVINGKALEMGRDFSPFIFSGQGFIKANASLAFKEKGIPWFWDIKDVLEKNKNNPHFDLLNAIRNKAIEFSGMGASACLIFNSGNEDDQLRFDGKSTMQAIRIPVVYLSKSISQSYLSDQSANLDIEFQITIDDKKRTGHNVIGYIDNKAPQTIILGAHYDHLGSGEDDNSLWTGKPAIHNGADDNASGVAAILELIKFLEKSKLKNNNYLFICFSGEELGLFGSKYFTAHSTIPLENVNYMINCDMVGRLNDSSRALIVGGYGTSPAWGKILPEKTKTVSVAFDSSGIGPSDHTSFYLKNIPVLFFFTGTHSDYHKPTDDVYKINFVGELRVIQYIENVLKETDKMGKLAFSKTREPQMGASPHFSVTLGIMPDYTYAGKGVHVDGVIEGRPGDKAGMKIGDVVIKIGDLSTTDINEYMTALSKFKKGDATKILVKRGEEVLEMDIIF